MKTGIDGIVRRLRHQTSTGIQLTELDAFRGWAITGVFCAHICRLSPVPFLPQIDSFLRLGAHGLDLFFVISGFLLYVSLVKPRYEGRPVPSLMTFYKRRARRLLPAYYVHILLVSVFAGSYLLRSIDAGRADLIKHLFLVHNLWPETAYGFNPPLWTLGVEAQFYIVLPFIACWFYGRRVFLTMMLFILFSLAYRLGIAAIINYNAGEMYLVELAGSQLPGRLSQFAVGMFFAEMWLAAKYKNEHQLLTKTGSGTVAATAGLVVCLATLYLKSDTYADYFPYVRAAWTGCFGLGCGMIVWGALHSPHIRKLIVNPVMEYLGVISYSVYLWHTPVLLFWRDNTLKITENNWTAYALYCFTTVLSTVIIGSLSYILFERPFLKANKIR